MRTLTDGDFYRTETPGGLTIAQKAIARAISRHKRRQRRHCRHEEYNFEKHGRCCHNCGTAVVDPGD